MEQYKLFSDLPFDIKSKVTARINLSNLAANYRTLCEITDSKAPASHHIRKICVVKADAYGHGAARCADTLLSLGCDFFAVSSLNEAVALRRHFSERALSGGAGCRHPDILILGYTPPEDASVLAEYNIIQTVFSEDYASLLNEYAARAKVLLPVHIKLDTGMNRIGFDTYGDAERNKTAAFISSLMYGNGKQEGRVGKYSNLDIQGIFTHFAKADDDSPDAILSTLAQSRRFFGTTDKCSRGNIDSLPLLHLCNSAASVKYPEYFADAVRYGIMLYGCGLPPENASASSALKLLPVMKLSSHIVHIHTLQNGDAVGYGGEYPSFDGTHGERRIATVPIGYADGIHRACRAAKLTLKHGENSYRVPVAGRICMDQLMLDVTGVPAGPGDEVVIFGENPGDTALLAAAASTIDYELLCSVSARVPRVYI